MVDSSRSLSQWLVRASSTTETTIRLYCFSPAGGSPASFLSWQSGLGPDIEVCAVQLPGHGARCFEPPYTSMETIVSILAAHVAKDAAGRPFAFFGHSLGALIAFELTHRLQQLHGLAPMSLLVSGCDAPQYPRIKSQFSGLDDDALIERLKDFNGTPPEVLQEREFMKLLLPAFRADFAFAGNYQYRPAEPLQLPIVVFAGDADPHAPAERAADWQAQSSQPVKLHVLRGDHFFHIANLQTLFTLLKAALSRGLLA